MISITQLIYLNKGQEKIFDQFESIAVPLIKKHNGRLLFRLRPFEKAFIASAIEHPYEIHLVEFDTLQDFDRFMLDEERKNFLHLKNKSIRSSILYLGRNIS
jgi:uncharacterized protein (DUF1330 family)